MNNIVEPDAAATEPASSKVPSPRSTKRRMAREPNASGEAPCEGRKPGAQSEKASAPHEPRGPSKIAMVVALLERPEGATLAEMVEATNWLPHTTRAALTGLKKKGHVITKGKRGDVTCYHIGKAG